MGLGLLRLSPRDFWNSTPREMAHVLRLLAGGKQGEPPGRQNLDALMALFPDRIER